jgi:subtilisin family serine protease
MRKSLFIGITLALSLSAHAADERCLVSFAGAEQDVCTGKVTMTNPALRELGNADLYKSSDLRLIKFDGPINESTRRTVEQLGAQILGYAPHYAYIVRMDPSREARVKTMRGVVWTGPFLPAFKIDPNLANELRGGSTLARDAGVEELVISLNSSNDRSSVQTRLASTPGLSFTSTVQAGGETRLLARFERTQLQSALTELAKDPGVSAIGFRWPMRLLNAQADWLHQSNVNSPSPLLPVFNRGLYGCGQIIGELDSGLHIDHCSFSDAARPPTISRCNSGTGCAAIAAPNNSARKVTAYYKWNASTGNPGDGHGHGTHVAGSAVGNNSANPVDCTNFTTPGGNTDLDGTAPGAKLVMQEAGAGLEYLNQFGGTPYHAADMAYISGARLHTNSWGGGCVNPQTGQYIPGCTVVYDAQTRDADNIARDRADMVVLYAAGNDGSIAPAGYNVGSPGNAKNVITVGATLRGTSASGMAGFSSRGPTNDARTKPDITAQGNGIISAARNACGTLSMSGTSMATPTAAGLAALVREYLQRGFYPSGQKVAADAIANPSGALIKALMINGAMPMTGTGAGTACCWTTRCTSTATACACTSTTHRPACRPMAWTPTA